MRALWAAALIWGAATANAETVASSVRPLPNPSYAPTAAEAPLVQVVAERSLRPQIRPQSFYRKVAAAREAAAGSNAGIALLSDRPEANPEEELALAEPTKPEKRKRKKRVSAKGSVCGVAAIKGEEIAPIGSRVKGCGVAEPVRVTSVSGVVLSDAATIDCDTARALNTWVEGVVQPAYDGQVVKLQVAAHYICRSRNNVKGAKISEHGRGKAIDISAFILANGKVLTVQDNYNKTMRRLHKAACGIFMTTLGPGSDGYHEDHLHLDTASRRSGSVYCR
jgi:hypothetical protein